MMFGKKTKIRARKRSANNKMQVAVRAYENMERRWLSERAGILALHLHDGESCPVCGSTNHPQKLQNKVMRSMKRVKRFKR